jgi:hypothetical protein
MTPMRFASCKRLLRGVSVLLDINRSQLNRLAAEHVSLAAELENLVKLMTDDLFANQMLLSSLSKRLGQVSANMANCEKQLMSGRRKDLKLNRAKQLLQKRLDLYLYNINEEELIDMTMARVSCIAPGQSATSKTR